MLPVLQVGPLAVQLPGLLLLLGLWLASVVIGRNAWRHGLDGDVLDRLLLTGLLAGVVGARLSYVLQHASDFARDPSAILSLSLTAFAPFEGAAIGVVAALVYGARKSLPFWPTLDALTPGAALLAVFVHLSQLASGDAFGAPTDLPWAIELWGERRHPAQLYALAASIAILGFVLWLQRRRRFAGELALGWLALSSAARLLLEASRGDSLYLAGVRQAQLAALVVLMVSLAGLHVLARRNGNPAPMQAPGTLEQPAPD
jgi:phosphatidylglycerol---prolipoprotein diacylglyceryl transferase